MARRILPALVWTLALTAGEAFAQQQFPYVAYVAEANAFVRSGPGQRYYPTQQLPQGFAVEVYRHDGDGWCAIRPPVESFSWIPAHQIRRLGQGIAEVTAERVVTRVGSALSPARSAVQVLLPRGEKVELFDAEASDDSGWVRIVAPAGEFRWLAARHLSRQPPLEEALPVRTASVWLAQKNQDTAETLGVEQESARFDHLRKADAVVDAAARSPVVATAAGLDSAAVDVRASNQDPNAIDLVAGSPAARELGQALPLVNDLASQPPQIGRSLPSSATSPRIRFRGMSAIQGPASQRVAELQLRLSQIVVLQPMEWHFDQIQSEANSLLNTTDSSAVRDQLRDLLDRIARFQQVRQRYERAALVGRDSLETEKTTAAADEGPTGLTAKVRERAKNDLAVSGNLPKGQTARPDADEPLYDAVGLLKPVASKRAGAPRYALVDDKGSIVSFVTPTPDLNLQPYLGRRIGVHGKRGFMPKYRRAHVTAGRVTPIEDRIRR